MYARRRDLTASEFETLRYDAFYGQERKQLAYIIGIMNMVMHAIETPNIVHTRRKTEK